MVFRPWRTQTTGELLTLARRLEITFEQRGTDAGMTFVKSVRQNLLNYLSGNPERAPGVRCTKDGIPLVLGAFKKELRDGNCPRLVAGILTVLYSTRALKLGSKVDTSSIRVPRTVETSEEITRFTKDFWRALGYKPSKVVPSALNWRRWHMTTKAGPNGHALVSALTDLYGLPESLVASIKKIGGPKLTSVIERLEHPGARLLLGKIFEIKPGKEFSFRRLASFPDKETKMRTVAILDYMSQTALIPFHKYLFRVLKKIPQDFTFCQSSFWERIKDQPVYYSIDLSAATDRFPIELIRSVLEAKLPSEYVAAWADIMVGYPFDSDEGKISYSVGNPMGAYSSWSSFALSHHYIVYYCCRVLDVDWATLPYALLGDDIVIAHKEVGEKYHQVITSLGLEASPLKTHKSKKFVEFAKRMFWDQEEITPFPISALKESQKRYYLLVNLLQESELKGWIACDGIAQSVRQYYKLVRHISKKKFLDNVTSGSVIAESITKVIRGTQPATDSISTICRQLDIPIPQWHEEMAQAFFCDAAKSIFCDSYDRFSNTPGRGLGNLAIDLVCEITDPDIVAVTGGVETTDLPILGAYGLVEEQFIELHKQKVSLVESDGMWPLWMKSMTLPLDDRVFTEKQSSTYLRASTVLGKRVSERLSTPGYRSEFEQRFSIAVGPS